MGWTEREKILTSYEEIVKYLEDKDCFHDYRVGNVFYDSINADVTIEEIIPSAKSRIVPVLCGIFISRVLLLLRCRSMLLWDFGFMK